MNAIERISSLLDRILREPRPKVKTGRTGAAAARAARIALLRHKARLGRRTSGLAHGMTGA
jgi:hypothetical protein